MCTVYSTEKVLRMLHLWRVQICMICMNNFLFKLVPLLLRKRMSIHLMHRQSLAHLLKSNAVSYFVSFAF